MVQSAPRRLPSCGSRCPGLRLELLTHAVQSPGEWSNLHGVKRCSGVGMTGRPGVTPHHQRAEGTLGPLPGPKKVQDHHQNHIRRLRCRTGKRQTHHHHHLWEKQRVSMWGRCSVTSSWLSDYHKLTLATGLIDSCNSNKSSKETACLQDKWVKHTKCTYINLISLNKR